MTQRTDTKPATKGSEARQETPAPIPPTAPPLARYGEWLDPFELLRRFTQDVDRLVDLSGFGRIEGPFVPFRRAALCPFRPTDFVTWTPAVDMLTRGEDLIITVELAGIKPEEVTVECEDNLLIIRGETHGEEVDKQAGYWRRERRYGAFYRSIPLPPGAPIAQAQAEYKNGLLEVLIPGVKGLSQLTRRSIPIQGVAPPTPPADAEKQPAPPAKGPPAGWPAL